MTAPYAIRKGSKKHKFKWKIRHLQNDISFSEYIQAIYLFPSFCAYTPSTTVYPTQKRNLAKRGLIEDSLLANLFDLTLW